MGIEPRMDDDDPIECSECDDTGICPYCGDEEPDVKDCAECQGDEG